MNEHGLTFDALRQQHADSVAKDDTFEPKGPGRREALDYLKTDEGAMYWWRVAEADPGAPSNQIDDRAINQLRSGLELPRMEHRNLHECPCGRHIVHREKHMGIHDFREDQLARASKPDRQRNDGNPMTHEVHS